MTGIKKRSNQPVGDQKKMNINPLYNTSAIVKAVGDTYKRATGQMQQKKKASK